MIQPLWKSTGKQENRNKLFYSPQIVLSAYADLFSKGPMSEGRAKESSQYESRIMVQNLTRSYHIIQYHIISYDIISHHMIWYRTISYHMISYHMIWYRTISYHMISYNIMSYHIVSYHTIQYHIIHFFILAYRGGCFTSCGMGWDGMRWLNN